MSVIADTAALDPSSRKALAGHGALPASIAKGMIQHAVGTFELPVGVATNFLVGNNSHTDLF